MFNRTHTITTTFENTGEGNLFDWLSSLVKQGWKLSYAGKNRYTGTRTITYRDPGEPAPAEREAA